jgi:hypothetical protein
MHEISIENHSQKPSGKLVAAPPKPLIAPGDYRGTILEWQLHRQFNSYKILFQIEVLVVDEILTLTHFTNIKLDKEGGILEPSATMKFARTLENLYPDTPFNEIDLDLLRGRRCIAKVKTVTKDSRKKEMPVNKHYSAIEGILNDPEAAKDPWK